MERQFLANCPYPEITRWLIDNKWNLLQEIREKILDSNDLIDHEIFIGYFLLPDSKIKGNL